jgi:regulator of protease activity HflC (stomatin/prohibitin superfamily)
MVVVLLTLFWIFSYRQVSAGEIGIVTRGGDVHRVEDAGPMVKWPWPVERLHKMDVKVQKLEEGAAASTSDLQEVSATLVLNYHLDRDEALAVFSEIGENYEEKVIKPAQQETFKAVSARFDNPEALIQQRAEVKAQALQDLRSRLSGYGVIVDDLSLTNLDFSEEFNQAVDQRQVAEQNALKAKAEAEAKVAEATGRRDSARLDAEAQELLQESLTDELLQKWAIEKWDGHMPQFMSGDGASTLFQIPLQPPAEQE